MNSQCTPWASDPLPPVIVMGVMKLGMWSGVLPTGSENATAHTQMELPESLSMTGIVGVPAGGHAGQTGAGTGVVYESV